MSILCAYQFEILPNDGQTAQSCLAAVQSTLTTWMKPFLPRKDHRRFELTFDGGNIFLEGGHTIRTSAQECTGQRLLTLEWTFPDSDQEKTNRNEQKNVSHSPSGQDSHPGAVADLIWCLSITLASSKRVVRIHISIQAFCGSGAFTPLPNALKWPEPLSKVWMMVAELLRGWSCRVNGEDLPAKFEMVGLDQCGQFFKQALFNPSRVLPIIAISFNELFVAATKSDWTKPGLYSGFPEGLHSGPDGPGAVQALQKHVSGLARIIFLDRIVVTRLSELVGKDRSCESGIRLYWLVILVQFGPTAG